MAAEKGRVTIPTDLDVIKETLDIMGEWGADAIRDCDGTEFPQELKDTGAKIYATYYTTRKDNAWAKAHPEEIQQMYIMTSFHTAVEEKLEIHLMDHLYPDMLAVNTRDDIYRWWEVIDRTTGETVRNKRLVLRCGEWKCRDPACEEISRIYSKFSCIHHVGSGTYVQCSGKRLEGCRAADHF